MKRSVKYCCIVVIIAILVGIFTFVLFNGGFLNIEKESFSYFYLTMIIIATALLITLMRMQCCNHDKMKNAYCNCGNLAVIGAAGTIILAFLSSLSKCACDFPFYAGISLLFMFLVLLLGGIISMLYTMNGCHGECIPEKPECRTNYEGNNTREYNHKEFIYPNNTNKSSRR